LAELKVFIFHLRDGSCYYKYDSLYLPLA